MFSEPGRKGDAFSGNPAKQEVDRGATEQKPNLLFQHTQGSPSLSFNQMLLARSAACWLAFLFSPYCFKINGLTNCNMLLVLWPCGELKGISPGPAHGPSTIPLSEEFQPVHRPTWRNRCQHRKIRRCKTILKHHLSAHAPTS